MLDRVIQIEASLVIIIFVYFAVLSYLCKESECTKSLEKAFLVRTKISESVRCNFELYKNNYTTKTVPQSSNTFP